MCGVLGCPNERKALGKIIRDVGAKFGVRYSPQSPDIGQNSDGGISNFRISVQSFIKETVITPEPLMILT